MQKSKDRTYHLKCINNDRITNRLTINKFYISRVHDVIWNSEIGCPEDYFELPLGEIGHIFMIDLDDTGVRCHYHADRFEIIEYP